MAYTIGVQMCEAEIRELGVLSGLRSEGFNARPLLELTESGIGFDVLILGEPDLRELSSRANYSGVGIRPTVVLGNAAPAEIRPILDMGASAIIDPEISVAGLANLLRYIAEVERPIGILPLDSLMHIRGCLEDLPTAIGVEDQELLRLLTTFTIEEAGRSMVTVQLQRDSVTVGGIGQGPVVKSWWSRLRALWPCLRPVSM